MAQLDLDVLRRQYKGTKYGDFVFQYYIKVDKESLSPAIIGTVNGVDGFSLSAAGDWVHIFEPRGNQASFWKRDAGDFFVDMCSEADAYLRSIEIEPNAEYKFSLFTILNLTFAKAMHEHRGMRTFVHKSTGTGIWHRFFSGLK